MSTQGERVGAICPICQAPQDQGLACHSCTSALERELGDVAAIVGELDITLSKQARIGVAGAPGLARERTPINVGAMQAADNLGNVLTTWARDVAGPSWMPEPRRTVFRLATQPFCGPFCLDCKHPSCARMRFVVVETLPPASRLAAARLLSSIPAIRRHPAVVELVDEITDAIHQARRAVDRPADRVYLGQCYVETPDPDGKQVTCLAELYARPTASEVQCKVCGAEHEVGERRAWLLTRAADMIVTVKDASQFIGEVGGIKVTQASIRGYLHRGKLAYRLGVTNGIRLGDLLTVVLDESERKSA